MPRDGTLPGGRWPVAGVKRMLLCYKRSTRSVYVRAPSAYGRRRPQQGEDGMAAKFEVFDDKGGKYQFHLKPRNGESIVASQAYATKANAHKGIDAIKKHASDAKVEDLTG